MKIPGVYEVLRADGSVDMAGARRFFDAVRETRQRLDYIIKYHSLTEDDLRGEPHEQPVKMVVRGPDGAKSPFKILVDHQRGIVVTQTMENGTWRDKTILAELVQEDR